ncbi:MAG: GNAT family N-acetyltransferase, partial [Pseudolabrys sp.]
MTADDLPLVRHWLAEPHVVRWWGNPDQQFDLDRGDLDELAMDQFIVVRDARPFAY